MCVCVSHPTNPAGPLVVHKLPMPTHLMQQLLAFVHPLLKLWASVTFGVWTILAVVEKFGFVVADALDRK